MRWLLGVMLLVMSQLALADGITKLKDFLQGLSGFQADFTQSVLQGKKKEKSTGLLTLQRPGRFRWDYEAPYAHLVLADGAFVWVYDPDLAQITRQKQASAVEGTPAQLLTNDVPVEKSFTLKNDPPEEGQEWASLVPKEKDSQYDALRVGFQGADLKSIIIKDKFNQVTRIDFTNIKRNPKLEWDFFVFEPPEGADLIEQ